MFSRNSAFERSLSVTYCVFLLITGYGLLLGFMTDFINCSKSDEAEIHCPSATPNDYEVGALESDFWGSYPFY